MKYKLIIFDFDGTIFDVMPCFAKAYREITKSRLSDDEIISSVRDLGFISFFIKDWKNILKIYKIVRRTEEISLKEGRIFNEIEKTLQSISQKKIITSTNVYSVIKYFISKNNLPIKEIYTPYFLIRKVRAIKKASKDYKKDEVLYIGDQVADIRDSKRSGVDVVAVTWGANSEKLLKKYNPTYIVRKPKELLKII
jgi:phosphoglycolate phosphatase